MCKAAEAAPAGSVSLEWKRLFLSITQKGKKKTILNGCDGYLPAGRLLAVMGPSGSGKTSFINVLADRAPDAKGLCVVASRPRDP